MADLRMMNEQGVQKFRSYLERLGSGVVEPPPSTLLTDPETSNDFPVRVTLEARQFSSRLEAAQYLHGILGSIDRQHVDVNRGMWTWLALFYFDQLCPAEADGHRAPGEHYRYILPPVDDEEHFRHYYRHLLAGPYRIYRLHRERARTLLHPPVRTHGDFSEQLASRMEFITNTGLIEAIDALYYDKEKKAPKRGATNRKKPGTLRRFISLVQQLDLTYDLYSLTGGQILGLLPREFEGWKTAPQT